MNKSGTAGGGPGVGGGGGEGKVIAAAICLQTYKKWSVPWMTSICLSLLQCMMPLPSSVIEAVGNFLVATLLAICTAHALTPSAMVALSCEQLTGQNVSACVVPSNALSI